MKYLAFVFCVFTLLATVCCDELVFVSPDQDGPVESCYIGRQYVIDCQVKYGDLRLIRTVDIGVLDPERGNRTVHSFGTVTREEFEENQRHIQYDWFVDSSYKPGTYYIKATGHAIYREVSGDWTPINVTKQIAVTDFTKVRYDLFTAEPKAPVPHEAQRSLQQPLDL